MKVLKKQDSTLVRATETISSPSHCLREIIENSLDAECTILSIRIGNGGLDHISVSDNGPGITEDGLNMICDEGVTSKEFGKDVSGGRGRALEAISYLSYLTIETCTNNDSNGYRLQFLDDRTRKIEKITRPKGTTVTAQTLFYAHPVRRHFFLEHKSQQVQEMNEVTQSFALACNANMTVTIDNKTTLQVSSKKKESRMKSVLGDNIVKGFDTGVASLDQWREGASLEYFTASPTTMSNGKIFLIVNNRPCVCPSLLRAVKNEFRLCAGPKAPSGVFYITAPRESFDFLPNAPLITISFAKETILNKAICEILSAAWKKSSEKLTFKNIIAEEPIKSLPATPKLKSTNPLGTETHVSITLDEIKQNYQKVKDYVPDYGPSYETIETEAFKDMEIIGQWNQSFIIAKYGCDIYAIDQHAAMEAQNFEKLRKNPSVPKQRLIRPVFMKLSPKEMDGVEENRDKCKEFGYDYEVVDGGVKIYSIPSQTKVASGADDLLDLISILKDSPGTQPLTPKARRWMAFRACHSSVRVGDTMNMRQMKDLLNRMSNSDFPWNCPHGRPTWCEIWSLQDIVPEEETQ